MAPGQDDPVPMSAVGVPEEGSGVVATAASAAAVAAAAALSLLVAWSRAKEQLAMVMHDGFKSGVLAAAARRELSVSGESVGTPWKRVKDQGPQTCFPPRLQALPSRPQP